MGWISKTFKKVTKAIKGGVDKIVDAHKKVFKGIWVDPLKKAWKNKVFRYATIAAAVVMGGALLAGPAAAGGTAATGVAAGTGAASTGAVGSLAAAGSGGIFPGMSLAAGGSTALSGGLTAAGTVAGGATGMTLGQAAALQLGGAALQGGAQALEAKRQEDALRRDRDQSNIAGVQYKGGTAEDAILPKDTMAAARPQSPIMPPSERPPGAGGMLSQAAQPDERVPYYLRG